MSSVSVLLAQRRLGLPPDGRWTVELRTRVRRFQLGNGLLVTGELNEPTVALLDDLSLRDPPSWEPDGGWPDDRRTGPWLRCDHPPDQL